MASRPRFDGQPFVDAYGEGGFWLAGQPFEAVSDTHLTLPTIPPA